MTTTNKVTKDSIIGEVINQSPEAKKIIEKYFGNGCFTCPGMKVETIAFGATMHNMDAGKIINEINELKTNEINKEGKNEG